MQNEPESDTFNGIKLNEFTTLLKPGPMCY